MRQSIMKKSAIALALLLIPAVILCAISCNSVSESNKDVAVRMMRIAPENVNNFIFYDWKAYREDNNLRGYYELAKEENFGDFLDSIDYMGWFDDGNLYLWKGNFTSVDDVVRQIKKGKEWNFYEYRGVRVATIEWFYDIALLGDICIEGHPDDIRQCIDIFLDGETSFYDHLGIKEVTHRLPSGISMEIWYTEQSQYGDIANGQSTFFDGSELQHVGITFP